MSSSCVDNVGYKAAEYYKTVQIINGLQNQIQTLQQELFRLKGGIVEGLKTLSTKSGTQITGNDIKTAFPTLVPSV